MAKTWIETKAAGVAALERGLAVLSAFDRNGEPLSLAELARRTGLHKSTIIRLAASLETFQCLERQDGGRYRLGPRLMQWGRAYQASFRLRDCIVPILQHLADATQESASFYIDDGAGEICLHRVTSPQAVHDAGVAEGDRFNRDDSAISAIVLAFTAPTTDAAARVKQDMFAVARGTRIRDAAAVAAPVFGADNALAGILQVSGPIYRFSDLAVIEFKQLLLAAAAHATARIGGDATAFQRVLERSSATIGRTRANTDVR